MQCYSCIGAGYITCPTCNGQCGRWKAGRGKPEWEPCFQCGGRRTVTCPTCRGTGIVGPDPGGVPVGVAGPTPNLPVPPPSRRPADPALLHLEGRWKAFGARYEFVKQNEGYRVTQFNLLGMKIAEGEAEASGNVLTMTVRNKLVGSTTADLQSSGDRLTGTLRGPIPLPITLKRAS